MLTFFRSEGTHTLSGTVFLPSSRFLFAVRGVFRTRRVSYEECFVRDVLRAMRAAAIYTSHYPFLYFSRNFGMLLLGCIEADVCK